MKNSTFLLKMKLTIILLLVAMMQVQARGYSQMITLKQQNAQLEDVFVEIMKQTNSKFVYSPTMLKETNPVNINLINVTLAEALELCFEGQPITYIIDEDNTVIVKMKELPPPPVKGRITDEQGRPIPFVNILIKGTTIGVVSNDNGEFIINVKKGEVLVFSFIGYQTAEVTVGDSPINVILKLGANLLDEVQIIGYGTTTKRENTGAISSVKAKDLSKQPVSNFAMALQGKMTGIVVNNSEGVGSGVDIIIRGLNSFGSGTRPLFIVDGVIINAANSNSVNSSYVHGTSPLGSINPNDIASIDILKDADATAIYGSRATNGVVLITTKKAELGKTRVNLDMYTGFNKATYMPKLLNTEQYISLRKEAFKLDNKVPTESRAADLTNLSPWKENAYTDWTEYEFGNNAPIMNANLDMSGGTKGLSYYFSTGYLKQYDIQPGDPYQERISTRLNLNSVSMNDRLESSLSVQYSVDKLKPTQIATNLVGGVRFLPPNYPLYTDQGDYYWGSSTSFNFANPEACMTQKMKSLSSNFLMSADFTYLIFKGLKAKVSLSYGNQGNESERIIPSTAINPKSSFVSVPSSSSSFGNYSSLNLEPQLTYNGKISDGNISVLVGSTWFKGSSSNRSLDLTGFPGDDFMGSWDFANAVQYKSSSRADERFRSFFGRVNYNWNQKYFLNLSYRRDGSSKFGDNYKWGDFGAIGASWIFSDESFIKDALPFLSFGKLRASWGVTGNDQIADYQYLNLYSADNVNYGTAVGLNTQYLYNEDIHWEQTKKLEAALEFGLFKSRISGSVSWYRNRTTDFLVSEPITSQTGFSSFVNNFDGVVQNTGWEFELRTNNIQNKNFQWRTNVNFTIAKNSLYEYDDLAGSAYAGQYEIGKPLDIIRRYYVDSISTVNGYAKFRDVNKDGALTNPADYVTFGSPSPRNYGGMENIFSYKGFELSFSVTCAQQLVTNWFMLSSLPGRARNLPVQLLGNYWQKPGDQATYPRATSGMVSNTNVIQLTYANISNLAYNDIMWFRLNNVSLTYTLPVNWVEKAGLSRLSVYARGQNLLFYSPVDLGKDPQAQSASTGTPIKSWVFGVQLSF